MRIVFAGSGSQNIEVNAGPLPDCGSEQVVSMFKTKGAKNLPQSQTFEIGSSIAFAVPSQQMSNPLEEYCEATFVLTSRRSENGPITKITTISRNKIFFGIDNKLGEMWRYERGLIPASLRFERYDSPR